MSRRHRGDCRRFFLATPTGTIPTNRRTAVICTYVSHLTSTNRVFLGAAAISDILRSGFRAAVGRAFLVGEF